MTPEIHSLSNGSEREAFLSLFEKELGSSVSYVELRDKDKAMQGSTKTGTAILSTSIPKNKNYGIFFKESLCIDVDKIENQEISETIRFLEAIFPDVKGASFYVDSANDGRHYYFKLPPQWRGLTLKDYVKFLPKANFKKMQPHLECIALSSWVDSQYKTKDKFLIATDFRSPSSSTYIVGPFSSIINKKGVLAPYRPTGSPKDIKVLSELSLDKIIFAHNPLVIETLRNIPGFKYDDSSIFEDKELIERCLIKSNTKRKSSEQNNGKNKNSSKVSKALDKSSVQQDPETSNTSPKQPYSHLYSLLSKYPENSFSIKTLASQAKKPVFNSILAYDKELLESYYKNQKDYWAKRDSVITVSKTSLERFVDNYSNLNNRDKVPFHELRARFIAANSYADPVSLMEAMIVLGIDRDTYTGDKRIGLNYLYGDVLSLKEKITGSEDACQLITLGKKSYKDETQSLKNKKSRRNRVFIRDFKKWNNVYGIDTYKLADKLQEAYPKSRKGIKDSMRVVAVYSAFSNAPTSSLTYRVSKNTISRLTELNDSEVSRALRMLRAVKFLVNTKEGMNWKGLTPYTINSEYYHKDTTSELRRGNIKRNLNESSVYDQVLTHSISSPKILFDPVSSYRESLESLEESKNIDFLGLTFTKEKVDLKEVLGEGRFLDFIVSSTLKMLCKDIFTARELFTNSTKRIKDLTEYEKRILEVSFLKSKKLIESTGKNFPDRHSEVAHLLKITDKVIESIISSSGSLGMRYFTNNFFNGEKEWLKKLQEIDSSVVYSIDEELPSRSCSNFLPINRVCDKVVLENTKVSSSFSSLDTYKEREAFEAIYLIEKFIKARTFRDDSLDLKSLKGEVSL